MARVAAVSGPPRAADYSADDRVAFAVDWRSYWRDRVDELERRATRTPDRLRPFRVRLAKQIEQARAELATTPSSETSCRT